MHLKKGFEMSNLSFEIMKWEYILSEKTKYYIINQKKVDGSYILNNNTLKILILK